jgi:hypothetical protein
MKTDKGGLLAGTALSPPQAVEPEQTEAQQPEVEQGADAEPNVSPEEQQQYEDFIKDAMELVYTGGKVNEGILGLLDDDPDDLLKMFGDIPELQQFSPEIALAGATVAVILETIRRGGDKPDDSILLHAGKEILEDLAELAGKAKVHDFTEEEMNKAVLIALDIYREAGRDEGLVDDDELKAQFAEVQQLDQEGRLGELLTAGSGQQQTEPEPETVEQMP